MITHEATGPGIPAHTPTLGGVQAGPLFGGGTTRKPAEIVAPRRLPPAVDVCRFAHRTVPIRAHAAARRESRP